MCHVTNTVQLDRNWRATSIYAKEYEYSLRCEWKGTRATDIVGNGEEETYFYSVRGGREAQTRTNTSVNQQLQHHHQQRNGQERRFEHSVRDTKQNHFHFHANYNVTTQKVKHDGGKNGENMWTSQCRQTGHGKMKIYIYRHTENGM